MPADINSIVTYSDVSVSPDGRQVLINRHGVTSDGAKRNSSLRLVRDMVHGEHTVPGTIDGDHDPSWSPDSRRIALLREVEGVAQLHILDLEHGSSCTLTNSSDGIDAFKWSPDGRQIAVTIARRKKSPPPPGVSIVTEVDGSYNDTEPTQIWIVDANKGCGDPHYRQLTRSVASTTLSFWSPDGQTVFFTTDAVSAESGDAHAVLHGVDAATGEERLRRPLSIPGDRGGLTTAPALLRSPDGRRVAFTAGNPLAPPDFAQDQVFILDLTTGATRNLTAGYDHEVGGDGLAWKNNSHLVAISNEIGNAPLVEIEVATGRVSPIWVGERVVEAFSLDATGGRLVAVASDPVSPPELYDVAATGTGRALTDFNADLRARLALTRPEPIAFRGPGGQTIHGWLQKPPEFDPARKYPLIVLAHGGPYAWWNNGYDGDIQAMAGAGYLVLFLNPRGSVSYGQAFSSALAGMWPGLEYDDTMAGVDYILRRPYVDGTRMGIAGGSAGGILTDWAITHTRRFAAAVSISSIADNSVYWFLGDQPDMERREPPPWLDAADRVHSPITYGVAVRTPTLFIVGTQDRRTPPAAGGEMMFRLLRYLKVPTALIRFEGSGHVIRSGSDPRHRGLSIHYLIRWMDCHLKGVPAAEFDPT